MNPTTPETGPARTGSRDPVFGAVLYFGAVLFLTLYIMIVLLQAWYYNLQRSVDQTNIVAPEPYTLTADQRQQEAQLTGYRWINRGQKIVSIPIKDAMQVTAWSMAEKKDGKP